MGVHDNADSKYSLMGSGPGGPPGFHKFAAKRPSSGSSTISGAALALPTSSSSNNGSGVASNSGSRDNTVDGEPSTKITKFDEQQQQRHQQDKPAASNGTAGEQHYPASGGCDKISLQQQRKALPVYRLWKKLSGAIRDNNTLIIIGETGSGKTTQIPQLLLNSGMAGSNGCIGITQPRRVAAISVARRVAQEQNVPPGKLVGYRVRFEDLTSPQTRIKYLTDGMMVREAMTDEILSDYSIIILDEAHERSVQTDVLLGVAKRAQNLRNIKNLPPLKLIVMSATMDVDKFVKYFQATAVYLEGRQHPVKMFHTKKPQDDYVFSALVTAFQIHRESPANEDILVFLTGQEEIEIAATTARQVAKQLDGKGYPKLLVLPLYSALPTHQQLEAFKPSPLGMRKLVLATNIAETSVTIGGIRSVIDTGVVKVRMYQATTGLEVLQVEKISKAQAWQRTGRAGREAPGKCYRAYTLNEFEKLHEMPVPEVQRCSLVGIALQLLAIGIDITTFDFMDKPREEAIDAAVECLEKLGAVKGSPPQLTTLGRTMSLFPLDPRYTKVILSSVEHKCLDEALTVIALISAENVFLDPPNKRQQALTAKSRFASDEGDHVVLLNVYRGYMNSNQKKVWCQENYLNDRNLDYAINVRKQLAELTERVKLEKTSCGSDTECLRRALFDGLKENLAVLQRNQRDYISVTKGIPVKIHPSSVLFNTNPHVVLFTEVVATGSCYIRGLSVIDPIWLKEKSGSSVRTE